jgi:hypothetical protein
MTNPTAVVIFVTGAIIVACAVFAIVRRRSQ